MRIRGLLTLLVLTCATLALGALGTPTADASLTQLPGADGCLSSTVAPTEGACSQSVRALNGAQGMAISPDGTNAYVAGTPAEGGLLIFDRNTTTGALTQKTGNAGCIVDRGNANPDPTCAQGQLIGHGWDGGPTVTVSPDGKNVYLVSAEYGSISVFDRDQATGALTQKSGTEGCIQQSDNTGRRPNDCDQTGRGMSALLRIVISPDGKNAYGSTWSESIVAFDRNTTTGALTQKSGGAGCFKGNTNQGCTALTTPVILSETQNLLISPDGEHVYATSYTRGRIWLFDRNTTTGNLTAVTCFEAIGGTGQCATHSGVPAFRGVAHAIAVGDPTNLISQSPDGLTIYASGYANGIAILRRDTSTGYLSQTSGAAGCIADSSATGAALTGCASARGMAAGIFELAVADDVAYLAADGDDAILVFARDATTGGLTQSAGTDGCVALASSAIGSCATGIGLDAVTRVALSPDALSLYAMARTSRAITTFSTGIAPTPPSNGGGTLGDSPAGSPTSGGGSSLSDTDPSTQESATTRRPRLRTAKKPRLVGTTVLATCAADIAIRSCKVVVSVPAAAVERRARLRSSRIVIGQRTVTVQTARRSISVSVPLNARGAALARTTRSSNGVLARVALTATAAGGGRASVRHAVRVAGDSSSPSAVTG